MADRLREAAQAVVEAILPNGAPTSFAALRDARAALRAALNEPAPALDVEALARAYRTALAVIEYGEVAITDPVALAEFRGRAAIAREYAALEATDD